MLNAGVGLCAEAFGSEMARSFGAPASRRFPFLDFRSGWAWCAAASPPDQNGAREVLPSKTSQARLGRRLEHGSVTARLVGAPRLREVAVVLHRHPGVGVAELLRQAGD